MDCEIKSTLSQLEEGDEVRVETENGHEFAGTVDYHCVESRYAIISVDVGGDADWLDTLYPDDSTITIQKEIVEDWTETRVTYVSGFHIDGCTERSTTIGGLDLVERID